METEEELWELLNKYSRVPPSGGSLEIGNPEREVNYGTDHLWLVPPSGGSLEIGNVEIPLEFRWMARCSPFGGIPRNWKLYHPSSPLSQNLERSSPFGGIPRNWKQSISQVRSKDTKFPLRGDP